MVNKKLINLVFICILIFSGCSLENNRNKPIIAQDPTHYLIIKSESNSNNGANSAYTQKLEIKANQIIKGNISSKQCLINYGEENPHCDLEFENINYNILKKEVEERYNLILSWNESRDLYWNEKEFIEVYNKKKGCEFNLCYEDGIIKKFTKESGSTTSYSVWEIKVLE